MARGWTSALTESRGHVSGRYGIHVDRRLSAPPRCAFASATKSPYLRVRDLVP